MLKRKSFFRLVLVAVLILPYMLMFTACGDNNNGGNIDPRFANAIVLNKGGATYELVNYQYSDQFNVEANEEYFYKFSIVEEGTLKSFSVWVERDGFSRDTSILKSAKIYKENNLAQPFAIADESFACAKLPIGTYYLVVSFNTAMEGVTLRVVSAS